MAELGQGQNLPEISVQLPAFMSLLLLWVPHITCSTSLTWLWEQLGFPFPSPLWASLKCLIFCAAVSQLLQMSDAVCGTECWEQRKRNPELKGVWVVNEILVIWKGWWLELYFFLIFLLTFKLQAPCKLCFVLHMHSSAQTHHSLLIR